MLDARLKGDVGILAERAFDELFPAVNEGQDRRDQVYYVVCVQSNFFSIPAFFLDRWNQQIRVQLPAQHVLS